MHKNSVLLIAPHLIDISSRITGETNLCAIWQTSSEALEGVKQSIIILTRTRKAIRAGSYRASELVTSIQTVFPGVLINWTQTYVNGNKSPAMGICI